jgi:ribonuclease D
MINYFVNDISDSVELFGDLAIDTEAMGLKVKRDRLCVIQICDQKGNVYIVHFPDNFYNYDCKNLKKFLCCEKRQKIFHYARFDVAIIMNYLNIDNFDNIYCTKIASRLTRTYTDSHGLKSLVSDFLKIELKKDQQSSNWGAQNLTEAQKQYAANDVIYLHSLRDHLNKMLDTAGRKEVANKYFSFVKTVCHSDLLGFDEDLFRHL